jgi:phosphoglycolate phosphatase-like HAD superfamily hydrolase
MSSLVLFWDIDGTLLVTGGAGRIAWQEATTAFLGRPVDFSALPTAGLTDVEIAAGILSGHGVPAEPPRVIDLVRAYEAALRAALVQRSGRVLPGVREILDHLRAMPGITSLLLTGNTAAGAATKLAYYGLADYFTHGAFADGAPDRPSIARKAIEIATGLLGRRPEPDRTYVIADTPRDVACPQAIGVRSIAVASGEYPADALRTCSPWCVLDQLPDPASFLTRLAPDGINTPGPAPSPCAPARSSP